jgi:hypothetical protein
MRTPGLECSANNFPLGDDIRMSSRKMLGISLMVALAGAFVAWNFSQPSSTIEMVVSGLLALSIFASWRFLVWQPPRK